MSGKHMLSDLVTLLKVFDANYVSDEDCEKLSGLDVSREEGVKEAVQLLLLPQFRSYTEGARLRLVSSLREAVNDPRQDFSDLFDRIELAFDAAVKDKRWFMQELLRSLESGNV